MILKFTKYHNLEKLRLWQEHNVPSQIDYLSPQEDYICVSVSIPKMHSSISITFFRILDNDGNCSSVPSSMMEILSVDCDGWETTINERGIFLANKRFQEIDDKFDEDSTQEDRRPLYLELVKHLIKNYSA